MVRQGILPAAAERPDTHPAAVWVPQGTLLAVAVLAAVRAVVVQGTVRTPGVGGCPDPWVPLLHPAPPVRVGTLQVVAQTAVRQDILLDTRLAAAPGRACLNIHSPPAVARVWVHQGKTPAAVVLVVPQGTRLPVVGWMWVLQGTHHCSHHPLVCCLRLVGEDFLVLWAWPRVGWYWWGRQDILLHPDAVWVVRQGTHSVVRLDIRPVARLDIRPAAWGVRLGIHLVARLDIHPVAVWEVLQGIHLVVALRVRQGTRPQVVVSGIHLVVA